MLQSHRIVTAEQLSEHFEISVRTIYRDVAALGEAGVPIMAEAGVGYSLMRGYNVPPIMFTEDETAALFMGGELTERFGDESLKKQMRAALLKVRAALPDGHKNYLNKLGDRIEVWGRPNKTKHNQTLMPIQEAMVRKRCLKLSYDTSSKGEISQRTVDPLGLMFYSNKWHLIAWCRLREAIRDFRLDRIQKLEVLKETFTGHESFSISDFIKRNLEDNLQIPIEIECESWVLDRVTGNIPASIDKQITLPDGRISLTGKAYSIEWIASWLVSMGTTAIAIRPEELKSLTAAEAEKILALYKS